MAHNEVPVTQIALKIQQEIDRENISIAQLAKELDMTYEYTRRLVKGMNIPSKMLLKVIAARFGWDFNATYQILVQDKFRLANGGEGAMAQPVNPEVEPFEKAWHLLDQNQKDILIAQFNLFLAQNRRSVRGGMRVPNAAAQAPSSSPKDGSKK